MGWHLGFISMLFDLGMYVASFGIMWSLWLDLGCLCFAWWACG